MLVGFSLFLGSFLAIFWFRLHKKQASSKSVGKKSRTYSHISSISRNTNPFRCVEIEPCLGACEKVKPYKHIKILLDKAPALPLSGCDHRKCTCRFIRYNDRRNNERRDKNNPTRDAIAQLQKNDKQRTWPDRRRA
jgi:hypothetical protein